MLRTLSLLILVCLLVSGCAPDYPGPVNTAATPIAIPVGGMEQLTEETASAQTAAAPAPTATLAAPASAEPVDLLHVILPDGSQVAFTAAELQALPERTIVLQDQQEVTGIPVLAVLEEVSWGEWEVNTISIQGSGLITVPAEKLDEDFLLIIGTSNIRFVSRQLRRSDWISDVTTIALN